VNNRFDIKENDKLALDFAFRLSRLFRSRWIWTFPLGGLLLCLRVTRKVCLIITRVSVALLPRFVQNLILLLCRNYREIASGHIHDSKWKDVKIGYFYPATWNFDWLLR
jgi:hypothetical protein